jgi:plasmid stabilization system protein ParE
VTILFAAEASETFAELAESTKQKASESIGLLERHPKMYPIRRRGLMRGYRYFAAGRHLFYYTLNSDQVRITAIIPGAMRQA